MCNWKLLEDKADLLPDGWKCPHEPLRQREYCIFHETLKVKRGIPKLAEQFESEFKKLVQQGGYDFTGFVFPDNIDLSSLDFSEGKQPPDFILASFGNGVSFNGAKFGDSARFFFTEFGERANFYHAKFGREVHFWHAKFGRGALFHNATFGDEANLESANFGNKANFGSAKFGAGVRFGKATFGDEADFENANFSDGASFYYAQFGDGASFSNVRFTGSANFHNATFGDDTYFGHATFEGSADFKWIRAKATAYTAESHHAQEPDTAITSKLIHAIPPDLIFDSTTFKVPAYFNHDDLSRTRFQQVDLSNLSFLHSQIHETRFVACKWGLGPEQIRMYKRGGARFNPWKRSRLLFDELIWRKKQAKTAVCSPALDPPQAIWRSLLKYVRFVCTETNKPEEPIDKVDLKNFENLSSGDVLVIALQLKQSLEASKDPIAAGDFHFAVMEMKRHRAKEEGHWTRAASLWLYKMISGYGERYGRTALWILLLIAGFSLIYADLDALSPKPKYSGGMDWSNRLEYGLYWAIRHVLPFKINTGFLNAFGAKIHYWSALQTIFGTTLFTFFALALRRRFKR